MLVFLFVPETFWDRTPRPRSKRPRIRRSVSDIVASSFRGRSSQPVTPSAVHPSASHTVEKPRRDVHVGFAPDVKDEKEDPIDEEHIDDTPASPGDNGETAQSTTVDEKSETPQDYFGLPVRVSPVASRNRSQTRGHAQPQSPNADLEAGLSSPVSRDTSVPPAPLTTQQVYTNNLRTQPQVPYLQSLRIWNGRISHESWIRVLIRPFILFAYPAVAWSSLVYALSVGWLIVLSEAVAEVYRSHETYNFSALSAGLIYISPFVGGLLGSAVAGKVSDVIVRYMSRRNGGVYEPEFRLVMVVPIAITTAMGLMAFGWSVQEKDQWIVPTFFFGVLSFGCSLGSTTAITFCVDSYRQYAAEALVNLNFSKSRFSFDIFVLISTMANC